MAQVLAADKIESRLTACTFWLTFTEQQFERIIWSDEKWFVLEQAPNRKNDVFWVSVNPNNVVPCRKAHGAEVMAWVGIVDGTMLPVHWFQDSLDSKTYIDMLKEVM